MKFLTTFNEILTTPYEFVYAKAFFALYSLIVTSKKPTRFNNLIGFLL